MQGVHRTANWLVAAIVTDADSVCGASGMAACPSSSHDEEGTEEPQQLEYAHSLNASCGGEAESV